ncbi:MAG: heavy metal translocating P-type ATPase [bacterium]|nr:heavy metal translocating P-type ATPase [bacterium]
MKYLFRKEFRLPFLVFALLIAGIFSALFWIASIILGIVKISWDSFRKIRERNYSLDYIALLAMVVSLFAEQYLAGAVVALMITGGEALEEYASARAEGALRGLAERIPKSCTMRLSDGKTAVKPIQDVASGETIIVKKNEIIPLDGTLLSDKALLNEANLTGEALPVSYARGMFIKSGSINAGETLDIAVEGGFETSTYMRIVHLVDEARNHKARIVRLAEKVNFPFTLVALGLALGAYFFSGELSRALAVLVIATPCPLIIAAPVAFIGGLSRAARRNIIVKRPVTLEELARTNVVFFDKTGTLTLGEISLKKIENMHASESEEKLLAIASAIEFHSIHPLARAVSTANSSRGAAMLEARNVREITGEGISGDVENRRYTITKANSSESGIVLSLLEGKREIARFHFEDEIKENVGKLFRALNARGITIKMLTGDKKENAERLFGKFGISILAECTPESKYLAIDDAKKEGQIVAMVGDGLNDAPAFAHANVGIVFSGTENSASIEAAGVVILGRDVMLIEELFESATRSVRIAGQSIWGGVGLSSVGMVFAAFGFIPPIWGALTQEVIDVAVILNSLRASSRT